MTGGTQQRARIDAAVMAEMRPAWVQVSCGNCGQTFASKGAKRRHKEHCKAAVSTLASSLVDADYTPPEDRYADMRKHITPRIRALANAEWDAMDAEGRLPADWPERRAEIERRFA